MSARLPKAAGARVVVQAFERLLAEYGPDACTLTVAARIMYRRRGVFPRCSPAGAFVYAQALAAGTVEWVRRYDGVWLRRPETGRYWNRRGTARALAQAVFQTKNVGGADLHRSIVEHPNLWQSLRYGFGGNESGEHSLRLMTDYWGQFAAHLARRPQEENTS